MSIKEKSFLLHFACKGNYLKLIQQCINDSDIQNYINFQDDMGNTALHHLASLKKNIDAIELLMTCPHLKTNTENTDKNQAWELALDKKNYHAAAQLINRKNNDSLGTLLYPTLNTIVDEYQDYIKKRNKQPKYTTYKGYFFGYSREKKIKAASKFILMALSHGTFNLTKITASDIFASHSGSLGSISNKKLNAASVNKMYQDILSVLKIIQTLSIENKSHDDLLNDIKSLKETTLEGYSALVKIFNDPWILNDPRSLLGNELLEFLTEQAPNNNNNNNDDYDISGSPSLNL